VAALSLTNLSPFSPVTTFTPLVAVVGLSMAKEGWEDWKRHLADAVENDRRVDVLDRASARWGRVPWRSVRVGDLVRVRRGEGVPADLLLLGASGEEGACYVQTANLDGETNLKVKKGPDETASVVSLPTRQLARFTALVECETPNAHLYHFVGALHFPRDLAKPPGASPDSWDDAGAAPTVVPLEPSMVLLRGSTLKNTSYAIGATLFTGHETKVFMNSSSSRSKRSGIERGIDGVIWFMFLLLAILCITTGAVAVSGVDGLADHWYLAPDYIASENTQYNPDQPAGVFFTTLLNAIVLYGYLVPIALYVTVEFVRIVQANVFISLDTSMYDPEGDTTCLARTSNLNEELGQIEIVLSDKTGTLTRNQMQFFKCSIGGVSYGAGQTEVERAAEAVRKKEAKKREAARAAAGKNGPDVGPEEEAVDDADRRAMARDVSVATGGADDEELEALLARTRSRAFNFFDVRLMNGAWRSLHPSASPGAPGAGPHAVADPGPGEGDSYDGQGMTSAERATHAERIELFLQCLSVCHTVIPTRRRVGADAMAAVSARGGFGAGPGKDNVGPDPFGPCRGAPRTGSDDGKSHAPTGAAPSAEPTEAALSGGGGEFQSVGGGYSGGLSLGGRETGALGDGAALAAFGPEGVALEAESPDEEALLVAAQVFGRSVWRRTATTLTVRERWSLPMLSGADPNGADAAEAVRRLALSAARSSSGGRRRSKSHDQEVDHGPQLSGALPPDALLSGSSVSFAPPDPYGAGPNDGVDATFEIIDIFPFDSARKRMSVVCRRADGVLLLFCKGADSVIYERLRPLPDRDAGAQGDEYERRVRERTRLHLSRFASTGLRTLALGYRVVDPAVYNEWRKGPLMAARASVTDREALLAAAYEMQEVGLDLLGATAIEDRLQAGVPECVEQMLLAGLRVWVLTGDKLETALNIGHACSLLRNEMDLTVLNAETREVTALEDARDRDGAAVKAMEAVDAQLDEAFRRVVLGGQDSPLPGPEEARADNHSFRHPVGGDPSRAGSSDGEVRQSGARRAQGLVQASRKGPRSRQGFASARVRKSNAAPAQDRLAETTNDEHARDSSLSAAAAIAAQADDAARRGIRPVGGRDQALVVAGRALRLALATPENAETFWSVARRCHSVICCRVSPREKGQVVRLCRNRGLVTLAVGDGANDVQMLQQAHVGIGIRGVEGQQAVMASDFAVGQFRFLESLLLVHGRWCYKRMARMICFFFSKNVCFGLTIFAANAASQMSGGLYYDQFYISIYNVLFTALAPLAIGLLDQDVPRYACSRYPGLYRQGPANLYFSHSAKLAWVASAMWQAVVCFFPVAYGLGDLDAATASGKVGGALTAGVVMFTCVIITVHLALATALDYWTRWHFVAILTSISLWIFYLIVYGAIPPSFTVTENTWWIWMDIVVRIPRAWILTVAVPIAAVLPEFLVRSIMRHAWPGDHQLVAEFIKAEEQRERRHSTASHPAESFDVNKRLHRILTLGLGRSVSQTAAANLDEDDGEDGPSVEGRSRGLLQRTKTLEDAVLGEERKRRQRVSWIDGFVAAPMSCWGRLFALRVKSGHSAADQTSPGSRPTLEVNTGLMLSGDLNTPGPGRPVARLDPLASFAPCSPLAVDSNRGDGTIHDGALGVAKDEIARADWLSMGGGLDPRSGAESAMELGSDASDEDGARSFAHRRSRLYGPSRRSHNEGAGHESSRLDGRPPLPPHGGGSTRPAGAAVAALERANATDPDRAAKPYKSMGGDEFLLSGGQASASGDVVPALRLGGVGGEAGLDGGLPPIESARHLEPSASSAGDTTVRESRTGAAGVSGVPRSGRSSRTGAAAGLEGPVDDILAREASIGLSTPRGHRRGARGARGLRDGAGGGHARGQGGSLGAVGEDRAGGG